jgi:hypothetical protein
MTISYGAGRFNLVCRAPEETRVTISAPTYGDVFREAGTANPTHMTT